MNHESMNPRTRTVEIDLNNPILSLIEEGIIKDWEYDNDGQVVIYTGLQKVEDRHGDLYIEPFEKEDSQ